MAVAEKATMYAVFAMDTIACWTIRRLDYPILHKDQSKENFTHVQKSLLNSHWMLSASSPNRTRNPSSKQLSGLGPTQKAGTCQSHTHLTRLKVIHANFPMKHVSPFMSHSPKLPRSLAQLLVKQKTLSSSRFAQALLGLLHVCMPWDLPHPLG